MSFKSTSNDSQSFVEVFTEQRRAKVRNEFLERVDLLTDWCPIQTLINKKLNKSAEAKGEPTYDGVLMFKIVLLEVWYNLSDRGVEELINDSISFGKFLGIDMEHLAPDHSTICRFRSALVEKNLWDKLLGMINKQLKTHGIMEIKRGVLVDASIVESPFSPDGSITIEVADDREDNLSEKEKLQEEKYMNTLCSGKPGVDKEGRWVKKGGKYRFVYKNVEKGLTDIIMKKTNRGKPLGEEEKEFNQLISKTRSKIEQTFGSIRRWFKGGQCRYRGLLKTHAQNVLEAICHNIKRAPNMIIELSPTVQ